MPEQDPHAASLRPSCETSPKGRGFGGPTMGSPAFSSLDRRSILTRAGERPPARRMRRHSLQAQKRRPPTLAGSGGRKDSSSVGRRRGALRPAGSAFAAPGRAPSSHAAGRRAEPGRARLRPSDAAGGGILSLAALVRMSDTVLRAASLASLASEAPGDVRELRQVEVQRVEQLDGRVRGDEPDVGAGTSSAPFE